MKPVVLLVDSLHDVLADVASEHDDLGVEFLGAHDIDEVREQLHREPRIATVIVGGGLDDVIRGDLVARIAARRPDLDIHIKNRASGPEGMSAFVRRMVDVTLAEPVA